MYIAEIKYKEEVRYNLSRIMVLRDSALVCGLDYGSRLQNSCAIIACQEACRVFVEQGGKKPEAEQLRVPDSTLSAAVIFLNAASIAADEEINFIVNVCELPSP